MGKKKEHEDEHVACCMRRRERAEHLTSHYTVAKRAERNIPILKNHATSSASTTISIDIQSLPFRQTMIDSQQCVLYTPAFKQTAS